MALPLIGLALMAGGLKRSLDVGSQRDEDRRRRLAHEDDERAYEREQRAYMRGQQQRTQRQQAQADALDASLRQAAQPVEVRTEQTWQPAVDDEGHAMPPNTAPQRHLAGDVPYPTLQDAQRAAAAQSSDAAVMRRQSKVMRVAGRPAEALQYAQLADRLEAEGITGFLDANLARAPAIEALRKGAVADFDLQGLDDFNATGKLRIPAGAKGRWQVLKLPNGQEIPDFMVVGADGKPVERITARQLESIYGYTRAERDRRASELYAQGKTIEHQARMDQARMAEVRQRGAGAAPPPIWDDKADEFLKKRYTVTDETGRTSVDGQGLQFAKAVALAQARRNGGDTTAALGFAFDIDNRIRTEAGGDPEKIRGLRAELLQRAVQPAAAEAPAGGRQQRPPGESAAAGGRVERPPVQARMAAPAREPAPAGSPQAAWDARQAALRQQQAEREAAQAAAIQRAQQQFDQDARTLAPLDLLTKYQDFGARAALSREQLVRLKAAEALVR
jgi:hypothetical protein